MYYMYMYTLTQQCGWIRHRQHANMSSTNHFDLVYILFICRDPYMQSLDALVAIYNIPRYTHVRYR